MAYRFYVYKGGAHPADGTKEMIMRIQFPCHKQPASSVYCGYYLCENIRQQGRYTTDPERVWGYSLLGLYAYIYTIFFTVTSICLILQ